MYQSVAADPNGTKSEIYDNIRLQLKGLLMDERNAIANAANFSALVFDLLPDLNWVGFYFMDEKTGGLVVGPFQGKPACVRIEIGRGVCGTAVAERQTKLVGDVHAFPGHIACDAASRSEIVVPLIQNDKVIGVLDIDSPSPERFDAEDQTALEMLAEMLLEGSDF